MADVKGYLDGELVWTDTGVEYYQQIYLAGHFPEYLKRFGLPVLEITENGPMACFFSSTGNKYGLDFNCDGDITAGDAFSFLGIGENTFASTDVAFAADLLTRADMPYIMSYWPESNQVRIDVSVGKPNEYLNFNRFSLRILEDGDDWIFDHYYDSDHDFYTIINNLKFETTYHVCLVGIISSRLLLFSEIQFTTGSAPDLPTVDVDKTSSSVKVNVYPTSGFKDYTITYHLPGESPVSTDYTNKTSFFSQNITGLSSGQQFSITVTTKRDGITYTIYDNLVWTLYRLSGEVVFDSSSGSGSFSSINAPEKDSEVRVDTTFITIPNNYLPTPPSGYSFIGWLFYQGTAREQLALAGSQVEVVIYDPNYITTAVAQYRSFSTVSPSIYDQSSNSWRSYKATIYDNGSWKDLSSTIRA